MKIILLAFALTMSLSTVAQREADEVLNFDNPVKDLLVVPTTGIAVITEGDKIHGYSPKDNTIIWSADAPKRNSIDVISEINMTGGIPGATADFMAIEDTPFVQKFFDDSMYVFNSTNGELLFTNEGKERFFEASYLFDENSFLLRGKEGKNLIIAKYSLGSKEMLWKTTVSTTFGDFMSSLGKLAGAGKEGVYDKLEYSDDKIFALIKNKFYALNKDSGELLWKLEEDNIKDFRRSLNGDYVVSITSGGFLGTKSEFDLFEAANGKKVWDKALVTKYLVLFEDWEDKMLLAHYKGFNFYSYKTGEKLWAKDPKGKGIKSVIPIGNDFLYVYDNEMMLLDKNGEKRWKKDVEISDNDEDPIYFLEKTNNGRVLYITATYANLVDYNTGKKIWKKNLKLNEKRPTMSDYDEKSGNFVIYNDEKLYKFNEDGNERPEYFAKLKLKDEKTISSMQLYPDVISITGQNEVLGVSRTGELKFHNTYKQPGEFGRKMLKGAAIASQIGGAVAAAEVEVYTQYRDSEGNLKEQEVGNVAVFGKKAQALGEAGYLTGTIGFQFVKDRYLAMQETDDFSIIFSKSEAGEKQLVKVNKQTGEEVDNILMVNNKPVYDIDVVNEDIYYSIKNQVQIFRAN